MRTLLVFYVLKFIESFLRRRFWINYNVDRNFNFKADVHQDDRMINIGAGEKFKDIRFLSLDFAPSYSTKPLKKFKGGGKYHIDLMSSDFEIPFGDYAIAYTSHTPEHLTIVQTARLFDQVYEKLKQKGTFRITLPDADIILNAFKRNEIEFFSFYESYFGDIEPIIEDYVFLFLKTGFGRGRDGVQNMNFRYDYYETLRSMREQDNNDIIDWLNSLNFVPNPHGAFHQSCYNFNRIQKMLQKSGFTEVYRSAFMQSNELILRDVPKFDSTHPWMSMYVECRK